MATLRASAKAGGVGRFGVGFSAVRAVSDEIGVVSGTAAVLLSRSRSADVLGARGVGHPGLAAEVARRRGDLPALRLPFAVAVGEDTLGVPVPDGYTTAVRLLLRGEAEAAAVRALLAGVDDTLLLALPALAEVTVEDDVGRRVLRDVADRWYAVRPVEERERPGWTLAWAVPRDGAGPLPGRLHAPAPTDEPLTLPALLLGTWPLDPARRHVAPGPVTDHLVARAGHLYAELAESLVDDDAVLALVPTGLPAGALDAALHETVVQALRRAAVLTEPATGDRVEPRAAQLVTGPLGQNVPAWLPLPAADGGTEPAGELTLPGSWAARVLDGLGSLVPAVVDRWGEEVFTAVGVHAGLSVRTLADVVAEPYAAEEPVEGWADYIADLAAAAGAGAYVGEVAVVEHLDAVSDDAWRDLLARLAEDPAARAALLTPVRTVRGAAPSYTAWWLREELGATFAHPAGPPRLPFLDAAPAAVEDLDDVALSALGAVREAADLDAGGWQRYVDSWPAADVDIPIASATELWRGLARAARDGVALEPPARVPVLDGTTARLAVAEDAVVAGVGWAQVRPVVPAPEADVVAVAELLDLDVPGTVAPVAGGAIRTPVLQEVRTLLAGAPATWWECEDLTVAGRPVDWWERDGQLWATTTSGLARAVAQAAGRWSARYAVELLLAEPGRLPELLAEAAGEP